MRIRHMENAVGSMKVTGAWQEGQIPVLYLRYFLLHRLKSGRKTALEHEQRGEGDSKRLN